MAEWGKVVIPGVLDSYIGHDGGLLCAEVDSHELLQERMRAHPIRSFFEKLRGRPDEPPRHILRVWLRSRNRDYTVAQIVYDATGELQSFKHDRIYATDDIGAGSPLEDLVPRSQQEIMDEIRVFFASAPGADILMAQLMSTEAAAVSTCA